MEYILNETRVLKEVLGMFVKIVYVDDGELERMYDFIFCSQLVDNVMPEDDSEIYDTLDFLRDLVNENGFTSADELMYYFRDQEAVSDRFIEEEQKIIPHNQVMDLQLIHDFYAEGPGVKLLSYQTIEPVKQYELIVDNLFHTLSKDLDLQCIEKSYREISLVKPNRPKDFWLACGLHTQLLPNTDHVHFDHYYRAFAPQEKVYVKVISLLKRFRTWFSGLSWKNPFGVSSDMRRMHRQRLKMKDMYKKINQRVREEQPIQSEEVQRLLSRIMMISKLNNPDFMAQHQATSSLLYRRYYQFLKKKSWAVLKSPSGQSWRTTDNPGFSIDVDMMNEVDHDSFVDPYWKCVNERSVIYFPLSNEYCLRLTPEQQQLAHNQCNSYIGFEYSSEREFQVINKLAIASQPEVLISAEGIKQRTPARQCCVPM